VAQNISLFAPPSSRSGCQKG